MKLQLRPKAHLSSNEEQGLTITVPNQSPLILKKVSTTFTQVFHTLSTEGASETELNQLISQADGFTGTVLLFQYLAILDKHGLLMRTLQHNGADWMTICPTAVSPIPPATFAQTESYRLSRFAYIRQENGQMLAETPKGTSQLWLHQPSALALYGTLAQAHTSQTVAQQFPHLSKSMIEQCLTLLVQSHFIEPASQQASTAEQMWEFHDLLFHSRSRLGRHGDVYGKADPFQGQIDPLPVVPDVNAEVVVPLLKPNLVEVQAREESLTAVMESRRSLRHHNQQTPLTIEQLGEFLYRTIAIRRIVEASNYSVRPLPSSGVSHELEVYPVVQNVTGIEAGMYYYHPSEHALYLITKPNPYVTQLLQMAWHAIGQASQPQLLLNITSRIGRVQWKYRALSYASTLKHVGILYQNMYLVATAMGLAPCALGGGNSDLFSLASGKDYLAEPLVGEFVLGSVGSH